MWVCQNSFFSFFIENRFFSHIIYRNHNVLSLLLFLPVPSFLLSPGSTPVSLWKRAALPWISTKHGVLNCTKTRHHALHEGWMGQPSRRKRSFLDKLWEPGASSELLDIYMGVSHCYPRYEGFPSCFRQAGWCEKELHSLIHLVRLAVCHSGEGTPNLVHTRQGLHC